MKDPLQRTLTPYEVLDLEPSSLIDKKRIESGFKKNFNKKGAREARTILNDPVKRLLVDVFMYSDNSLGLMAPEVNINPEHLIKNRTTIARSWNKSQKKYFPYYPITHMIAVFWYWWLIYEEERLWSDQNNKDFDKIHGMPDPPPVDEIWRDTISNWTTLINCDEFWNTWIAKKSIYGNIQDKSAFIGKIKKSIEKKIKNHIHNFSEKYRLSGNIDETERFRNYSLLFSAEKKSSEEISKSGISKSIKGKDYFYTSGRMLLERLNILKDFQNLLEIRIKSDPDNNKLQIVRSGLSPLGKIHILAENGEFAKALVELSSLPDSLQSGEEFISLKSDLTYKKGKQFLSIGKWEEAINIWKTALNEGALKDPYPDSIVDLIKEKSNAARKRDPDKAIHMLESLIEIIPNEILTKNLSSIFLDRGIKKMNEALKKIPRKTTEIPAEIQKTILEIAALKETIKNEAEQGLQDMQKAVELDSENKNAITQVKTGISNISDIDLLDIYKAIELKSIDYASKKLKIILKNNPGNIKARELYDAVRSNLCWFCKDTIPPNSPDPDSAVEVKMYKITSRDLSNIKWQILDIKVPRCKECKIIHNQPHGIGGGMGFIFALVLNIIVAILAKNFSFIYFFTVSIISITGGEWIYSIATGNKKNSSHGLHHKMNFPIIKQKLNKEWEIGDKPPGIVGTPNIEKVND